MKEIKIRRVSPTLHQELFNISANLGISMNSLLKPKLREIANSYPEELKREKPNY